MDGWIWGPHVTHEWLVDTFRAGNKYFIDSYREYSGETNRGGGHIYVRKNSTTLASCSFSLRLFWGLISWRKPSRISHFTWNRIQCRSPGAAENRRRKNGWQREYNCMHRTYVPSPLSNFWLYNSKSVAGMFSFFLVRGVEQNSSPLFVSMGVGLLQIVSSRKTRLSHLTRIYVWNPTAASAEVFCCYFAPKRLWGSVYKTVIDMEKKNTWSRGSSEDKHRWSKKRAVERANGSCMTLPF